MPNGIEVLQAALSGKRVRQLIGPNRSEWLRWSGSGIIGEDGGARSLAVRELWEGDWEIDEPTLTFTDAVAAMDAGQIVTKGDGATKYRWEGSDYWYCTDGDQEWFPDAVFGWEEIHATDWRIVRAESEDDERPTRDEATKWLYQKGVRADASQPDKIMIHAVAEGAVYELSQRWPAMFREEES